MIWNILIIFFNTAIGVLYGEYGMDIAKYILSITRIKSYFLPLIIISVVINLGIYLIKYRRKVKWYRMVIHLFIYTMICVISCYVYVVFTFLKGM